MRPLSLLLLLCESCDRYRLETQARRLDALRDGRFHQSPRPDLRIAPQDINECDCPLLGQLSASCPHVALAHTRGHRCSVNPCAMGIRSAIRVRKHVRGTEREPAGQKAAVKAAVRHSCSLHWSGCCSSHHAVAVVAHRCHRPPNAWRTTSGGFDAAIHT